MHIITRALAVVAALALPARASSLPALLDAVAANERFPAPTRGTIDMQRIHDGTLVIERALTIGNRRTIYLEMRNGLRALVRPSKIVVRGNVHLERLKTGTPLGDSDFRVEDLVPVTRWLLKVPQVSDEGPTGTVVTGAPSAPSARALLVLTIDPDTHVVTRRKYYEGSVTNLAALRHDDKFVDVGGHQRPTEVVVERPGPGTSTRATITWQVAPDTPPGVFTLAALRGKKSLVTW